MSRLSYTKEKGYALFLLAYAGGYGIASLMNDVSVYVHISYNGGVAIMTS